MQFVSRPVPIHSHSGGSTSTMLGLTVDRLVGNGHGHTHTSTRLPLSPDSCDTGSESGSVRSSSTEPGSRERSSPPIVPKSTSPPSTFSKITLLLSKSTSSSESNKSSNICSSPGVKAGCEFSTMTMSVVRRRSDSGESQDQDQQEPALVKLEGDGDGDNISNSSRLCHTAAPEEEEEEISASAQQGHEGSLRSIASHCCLKRRREEEEEDGDKSPNPRPHSHSHSVTPAHNSLKFSIHDILRPDFGLRALAKTNPYNHFLPSPNNLNNGKSGHHTTTPNNHHRGGNPRPSRPSSVKNHSEDSNSSCNSSSRTKDEVVDEAKVNPAVPKGPLLWPAWVYCTRYSDRPSSGPRSRRIVRKADEPRPAPQHHNSSNPEHPDEKRPRTAFTAEQLGKLKQEFDENRYLTEKRRQDLARDLKLHENQIKIWFQNKRAKLKKSSGQRGGLALQLMAQGLYNHSTVPMDEDDDYIPC